MLELLAFLKDETDKTAMDEKIQTLAESLLSTDEKIRTLAESLLSTNADLARAEFCIWFMGLCVMALMAAVVWMAVDKSKLVKRLEALERKPGQQLAA